VDHRITNPATRGKLVYPMSGNLMFLEKIYSILYLLTAVAEQKIFFYKRQNVFEGKKDTEHFYSLVQKRQKINEDDCLFLYRYCLFLNLNWTPNLSKIRRI
jgi:hypothetical protein